MAKKTAKKKAAAKKTVERKTAKKAKGRRDLPGQKVMKHGPKKIDALEKAGAAYVRAEGNEERVKADAKEKKQGCYDEMFRLMKQKRVRSYTTAGKVFSRESGSESMTVKTLK